MVRLSSACRAAVVATAAALVLAVSAWAATSEVDSQPNGDFSAFVHVRSDSDRDRDGNADTATHGDRLFGFADVCRRFDVESIVQYVVTVDGPGTAADRQRSGTADLQEFSCVGTIGIRDRVTKKWGTGPFTVTLTATNDNGDTATASASITIH